MSTISSTIKRKLPSQWERERETKETYLSSDVMATKQRSLWSKCGYRLYRHEPSDVLQSRSSALYGLLDEKALGSERKGRVLIKPGEGERSAGLWQGEGVVGGSCLVRFFNALANAVLWIAEGRFRERLKITTNLHKTGKRVKTKWDRGKKVFLFKNFVKNWNRKSTIEI